MIPPPKLTDLLRSRDTEHILWGAELAAAIGDPALFDHMLHGVSWRPPSRPDDHGTLFVRGWCQRPTTRRRWDLLRALALLAVAPPDCETASRLLARITSLSFDRSLPSIANDVVDLAPLAAFTRLERLAVRCSSAPRHLDALARLPHLCTLSLDAPISDLSPLAGAPALHTLTVTSATRSAMEGLRDLPSLRALDLLGSTVLTSLDFMRELPEVERLSLSLLRLGPREIAPLTALPRLRSLSVVVHGASLKSLDALTPLTSLEALHLDVDARLDTLAPLRALPHLQTLRITRGHSIEALGLDGVTSLRDIHLDSGRTPADLISLRGCDLRTFTLAGQSEFEDLSFLEASRAIEQLSLRAPQLRTLDSLPTVASLSRLTIVDATSLASVAPLVDAHRLEHLALQRCCALTSLAGLEGCDALTWCELEGGAFTDVAPLSALENLTWLSLRECAQVTDVRALDALPNLTALVLTGSGVTIESLTPKLRAVATFAEKVSLEEISRRAPRRHERLPPRLSPAMRVAWPRVRALLGATSVEHLRQGVELARALGDATLYDAILRHVRWRPEHAGRPFGVFRLQHTPLDGCADEEAKFDAMLTLLNDAPELCEVAWRLRREITSLRVPHRFRWRAAPIDARALGGLTSLRALQLHTASSIEHLEVLEALTSLESLSLSAVDTRIESDLSSMRALESVSVVNLAAGHLARLLRAPKLRELTLHEPRAPGDGSRLCVGEHASLTRLSVRLGSRCETLELRDLPSLIELSVSGYGVPTDLEVTRCPRVRTFGFYPIGADALRSIEALDGIETLTTSAEVLRRHASLARLPRLTSLKVPQVSDADCATLAAFTELRALDLSWSSNLRDVSALAALTKLESLDLKCCRNLERLDGLDALPLRSLDISWTSISRDDLPERLRRVVRT